MPEDNQLSGSIVAEDKKFNYYKSKKDKMKAEKLEWHDVLDQCYLYAQMIENYTESVHTSPNVHLKNTDSFVQNACEKLAGILKGMLWPSAGQTFFIGPAKKYENSAAIIKDVSHWDKTLRQLMDEPNSYCDSAMFQAILDAVIGGTIGIKPRVKGKGLFYKAYGPKDISIDTNSDGLINAVGVHLKLTVAEIMDIYGEDKLTREMREQAKDGKYDSVHEVVWLVAPNVFKIKGAKDNTNFEYISLHMVDKCGTILKESGYHELPIKVGRTKVRSGEKHGRSFMMSSIADTKNMNEIGSYLLHAAEATVMPIIGYFMGAIGTDTVDFEPGEWVPFDETKVPNGRANPTFPIFEVGDLREIRALYNDIRAEISNNFMLDRLLDFNNQTQMTAQEARIRSALSNQSNNGFISRFISEFTTPTIERSFNIAYDVGLLGVGEGSEEHKTFKDTFPGEEPYFLSDETVEALKKGDSLYEINYVTEASRITKNDKIQSILSFAQTIGQLTEIYPEAPLILKTEKFIKKLAEAYGIDPSDMRTNDEIEELKQAMQAKQQQQAQLQARQEEAQTQKLESEAANEAQQASAPF